MMTKEELLEGYIDHVGFATEEEIESIFYAADLNKDGYLDIQEWKSAMLMR